MELQSSLLDISDKVISEAVLTGSILKLEASIALTVFLNVYKDQIHATGLTSEKALYLALKTNRTATPSPVSRINQILR